MEKSYLSRKVRQICARLSFGVLSAHIVLASVAAGLPVYTEVATAVGTCNGLAATIVGSGAINGTGGSDVILGSSGADTINGGGGNDTICGDGGNDVINGDLGNDTIFGDEGNDTIDGGVGNDTLNGGNGDDIITGGLNNDTLNGNDGNDSLKGDLGNDGHNGGNGTDACTDIIGSNSFNSCEAQGANGVIVIRLDSEPNNAQDFAYTGAASFNLDDDADGTNSNENVLTRSTGFGGTSYSFIQNAPANWTLNSITCTDPNGSSSSNVGSSTAVVDLNAGEVVTCTFSNSSPDADSDEVPDYQDNCVYDSNSGQEDEDEDGFGDVCSSDVTLDVTPVVSNNWTVTDEQGDVTPTAATHQFVLGPATAPLGLGSLKMTVPNGFDYSIARNTSFDGVKLSDLTALSYDTYVNSFSNGQAPVLSLKIDTDNDGEADDALYFEPVYQTGGYSGDVVPNQCPGNESTCAILNTWQHWNALSGGWWTANDGAGGPPLHTIAGYLVLHPTATIVNTEGGTLGGVRMFVGAGVAATASFDNVVVKVDGNKKTYNFDPIAPPVCDGSTTFDTFANGSVNGQGGWESTGTNDQAVTPNIYGFLTFGCKTLRMSNAVGTGGFADQTFTPSNTNEAGETSATNGGKSGGVRQNHFEAQFDLASTSANEQPGLSLSVSPDRGDGSRMSYLRFDDTPTGIDVTFYDTPGTTNPANFNSTLIATGLSRATPHTIKFSIDFHDGPSNDVVQISIDGSVVHTGTTWENYYRYDTEASAEQTPRTVDSLIFRSRDAVPAVSGNGFIFDNFSSGSSTNPSVCGNTFIESGETCDDGNTTSDDGCSAICQIEVPPVCGDGHIDSGEQCDDGETDSGDGCSASCQNEIACTPTDEPLVAYWNFDEGEGSTANDTAVGTNDAGTLSGSGWSADVPALGGFTSFKSLDFDGASDAVTVGDAPSLKFDTTDDFSASAWVKPTSFSGYQTVVHKIDDASPDQPGYLLTINNGVPEVWIINSYAGDRYLVATSSVTLSAGVWQQVSFTYDGSGTAAGVKIYVNGSDATGVAQHDTLVGSIQNSAAFEIGRRTVANAQPFYGLMDDVRMYSDVLTPAEEASIYGGTCNLDTVIACGNGIIESGETCDDGNASGEDGCSATCQVELESCYPEDATLTAYWKLDDGESATTALDVSDGESDGTVNGGPTTDVTGAPGIPFENAGAYSFDGENDSVEMPGNIGDFTLATPFTVSAWINPVLDSQNHAIYGNTWSDGGYLLRVNAENKVRFIIVETGGAGSIYQGVDSNVLTPGWHHVVGTWDGTNVHVYVDGVEESITPIVNGTMTNISTTAHTFIGSTGQLGSEQLFEGSIDDVRVYSEALDSDAISDLAGGECSVGTPPSSSSSSSSSEGSSSSSEESSSSSSSEGSSLTCTEDGLYAFWKFEETVGINADDSVGSHDGTLENGLGFGGEAAPTDNSSLGLAFDGTDDDVLVGGEGAATDFAFGTTDFTVSAWTKVSSVEDANRSVLGHFDNSSGYKGWGLYFYSTGNVNFFGYGNNGANDNSFAAPSVLDGGWHNVTGVYKRSGDNLVIETYVDGVLVGTTPSINVGNMFISTPMTLGRYTFQPNFKGGMDEVRIYDRALTAEEVSQIAGGCYAPESSSSSSEGGSSSSSSSEGGGTDGGDTGGTTGGTTGGNNIFSFSSFNGGHHGNTTDQLGAATNFVINNNQGGAFGGGPDPRICSMQRRLGPNPIQGRVDFVAKILAKVLDISQEQIALYLVDPAYCEPINAAVIRPAKPVAKAAKATPFYVDANGIPVSRGNMVFDLCVANKSIPYPLVKSTGKSCDDYYISDGKWKHPDHPELEYFTLKLKPKVTLTVPTGYKVTLQSLTVGKK